jgi:periplasmic protein TonB
VSKRINRKGAEEESMWDETLIESRKPKDAKKRWWSVPASMIFHGGLIFFLIFASYWSVGTIAAVPLRVIIYKTAGTPMPYGQQQAIHRNVVSATPAAPTMPAQAIQQTPAVNSGPDAPASSQEQVGEQPGDPNGVVGIGDFFGKGGGNGIIGFGSGENSDQDPHIITSDINPPVLIRKVEPEYPPTARTMRLQGTVILQAVITTSGTVENVQISQSVHPLLDQAASKAVVQWQYRPATLKGRPIKVYFTVTVRFILH